jgi:tetratricopeptide (TPR) repeat protein
VEVRSERFQVFTDAGERAGRQTAERFEQIRRVLGPARESPLAVRIYVFSSSSEFRRFRPSETTRGFYQSGPDRDYIAMEHAGQETYRIVYHEYLHLVLNHTSVKLPLWFEEGIAEFYSTLEAAGSRLRIGKPVEQHVSTLLSQRWLGAGDLGGMTKDSPLYREGIRSGVLYAESWALVHMLYTAPAYRTNLERFTSLLAETVTAEEAFHRAFGRTMEEALSDLRELIAARKFPVAEVDWRPADAAELTIRKLTAAESELVRAELLVAVNKGDEVLRQYRKLAGSNPDNPAVQQGLGQIMLAQNRRPEAMEHFKRAISLGSRQASVWFECAVLLRESGAPVQEVRDYLRKTVELNPHHAEALFLLGNLAFIEKRTEEAIGYFQRASAVLPRQSYFWQSLALAYAQQGQKDLAQCAARRAFDCAATQQEAEGARAALRLTGTPTRPPAPKQPAVVTPEGWFNRRGDQIAEGLLVEVECREDAARLVLQVEGRRLVLNALRPNEIVIRNSRGGTRELPCGKVNRLPVQVEYISKTRDIVAVEFR